MANLRTVADLLDEALQNAGEKTDGTSEFEAFALTHINHLHRAILAGGTVFEIDLGEPWPWAKSRYPGLLVLEPFYDTGSVSLTSGSTAGTFSTAPAASLAGRYLKVADRPEVFRIASHTAGTTPFTLDGEYTDDTGSGLSFEAHKLDYALDASQVLRLFSPFRVYRSQSADADNTGLISNLALRAFDERWPLRKLAKGTPTEFTEIYSTDGTITVRFNKSVETRTRLEYDYIPVPTDLTDAASSIPLLPEAHRRILSYGTAHDILVEKEDDKAQTYFGFTQVALKALVSTNRREKQNTRRNYGRIIPRLDMVRNKRWATEE